MLTECLLHLSITTCSRQKPFVAAQLAEIETITEAPETEKTRPI